MMEACVHGSSTRSVDDLVVALDIDSGISKSEIPHLRRAWINRSTGCTGRGEQ